jgi:hypothetical protein
MFISALALFASVASAAPMPYAARQSVARRSVASFESGTYLIISHGSNDEKFAINFNDQGTPATMTAVKDDVDSSQKWIITDNGDGTQTVSPSSNPKLEVSWDGDNISPVEAGGYVWKFQKTGDGYTIQDGGLTAFWGVAAAEGAQVMIGAAETGGTQLWYLEPQDAT